MSEDASRLRDINAKMLTALWRVQLSARVKGGRIVAALSPETMRAVGTAIIKAEGGNDERA